MSTRDNRSEHTDLTSTGFGAVLDTHRSEFARRQQRGLHFVAAAAVAWTLITLAQAMLPGVGLKNLTTFMAAAVLMPLAWLVSRARGIPFQDPSPLSRLGLLISITQALYLPIAMWVYPTVPERFVMVLAVITTAHLLPFAWLYDCQAYLVGAVAGTVIAVLAGLTCPPAGTALATMLTFTALTAALWRISRRPTSAAAAPLSTGAGTHRRG